MNAEVRTRVKRKCFETSLYGHEDTSVDTKDEASTSKRKRVEESPDRGPKMITAVAKVHRNAPDISDLNVTVRPSNSFSIRRLLSESRTETTPSARTTKYDYVDYDLKGFTGNINHWLHNSMGIVQRLLYCSTFVDCYTFREQLYQVRESFYQYYFYKFSLF